MTQFCTGNYSSDINSTRIRKIYATVVVDFILKLNFEGTLKCTEMYELRESFHAPSIDGLKIISNYEIEGPLLKGSLISSLS